jgi:signal transduction histidine kinase/ActR/RegA family two-component response regulator
VARTSESSPSGRISERLIAAASASEQAETVEALVRIQTAASEGLDPKRIAQRLADEMCALTSARGAAFHYESHGERGVAFAGAMRAELEALGPSSPSLEPVFAGRATLHVDDGAHEDAAIPAGVRSMLAVPLLSPSGRAAGVIVFVSDRHDAFDSRDEALALAAACHAQASLENARLYEEASEARARAEAASRAKDEFLATVSHELRNPLNAILGWARVLVDEGDALDRGRMVKGLGVIERNAQAQVQLVEDILEVSRIITGKLSLSTGPVDVKRVVEVAIETVRSATTAKGIILETRFEDVPHRIVADEDRLQQVLWNLLSNAVKFTPRGGVVRVSARRWRPREADEAVEISVSDDGEGIDPEFLPFVFDRFRQADASPTRRHGGLGLGLAIVRHLVELHGGTVRAESGGRGRGATFVVTLPVDDARTVTAPSAVTSAAPPAVTSAASDPPPAAHAERPLASRRVVVLDDEEDMRELIAMILEHAGARVVRVATVDAALRAIEADPPDVAVSDVTAPGDAGYSLLTRVRASTNAGVRALPILAVTPCGRIEEGHRALEAGFQRQIAKPIEPTELVSVLSALAALASRP